MRKVVCLLVGLFWTTSAAFAQSDGVVTHANFKNPPAEYRPIAQFGDAGGGGNFGAGSITDRLKKIYDLGYGGVMFAPSSSRQSAGGVLFSDFLQARHTVWGLQPPNTQGYSPWVQLAPPGVPANEYGAPLVAKLIERLKQAAESKANVSAKTTSAEPARPGFLTREYFDRLKELLAYSKQRGRYAVFYDEAGYPSGMADHTAPKELYRKILQRSEETVTGPKEYRRAMPQDGPIMAVVAMNRETHRRLDLAQFVKSNELAWNVPSGEWKVMIFHCITSAGTGRSNDYQGAVDYLDPDAVRWFLDTVYEPHAKEVGGYFGNVINMTFFDDVGLYPEERTWAFKFNEKFKERFGKDPATYYPALWEDIGPETESARVAFFDTRAELLADGFPKTVAEWGAKHNLPVSGHCPGNYEIGPVDMNGDPIKFYRAQPVPMADVIFNYPFGRDGFKLISDGADLYDKPVVAAEIFNPFQPAGTPEGYRRVMELYIRGINRPVGTSDAGPATWADWLGRTSMLLQGGRRESEIAIFYPIAAMEAFYRFDAPEFLRSMRVGSFVPYDTDYLAVGEMLLNEVHRDYTLMHPDIFLSEKVKINGASLELDNRINKQAYKLLILPGQKVISLKALRKVQAYYEAGGTVLATSLLPSKAAELAGSEKATIAKDREVQTIIKKMFGIDSSKPMPEGMSAIPSNSKHGKTVFIRKPSPELLGQTLEKLGIAADVTFAGNPTPSSGGGAFSYVHKVKEGKDIYFFANSSNDAIDTSVEVRGRIKPEVWDPYAGESMAPGQIEYTTKNGIDYTRFALKLKPITSTFVVGRSVYTTKETGEAN